MPYNGDLLQVMLERRRHPRTQTRLRVRLEAPTYVGNGMAINLSEQGVCIRLEQAAGLQSGTDYLRLHFEIETAGQILSRQLEGRLLRQTSDHVALRFVTQDLVARAVVAELLFYYQQAQAGLVAVQDACA